MSLNNMPPQPEDSSKITERSNTTKTTKCLAVIQECEKPSACHTCGIDYYTSYFPVLSSAHPYIIQIYMTIYDTLQFGIELSEF